MSPFAPISPLFSLLLLLLLPPILAFNTLDTCRQLTDCDDDCISFSRGTIEPSPRTCTEYDPTCRCFPSELTSCSTPSDCSTNETCVLYTLASSGPLAAFSEDFDFDNPFCASADAEQQFTDIELFPLSDDSTPTGNTSVFDDTTPYSSTGGLTLDTCRDTTGCIDLPGRITDCVPLHRGVLGELCEDEFPNCRCIPSDADVKPCDTDIDCVVGEVCATYIPGEDGLLARLGDDFDFTNSFCVSAEAEATFSDVRRVSLSEGEEQPTGNQTVVDVTTPLYPDSIDKLAFEKCNVGDFCIEARELRRCSTFSPGDVGEFCFDEDEDCRCLPIAFLDGVSVCRSHDDCIVQEACVRYVGPRSGVFTDIDDLDFTQPFCMSVQAARSFQEIEFVGEEPTDVPDEPDEEPGFSAVCIDARHVSHLGREELVYGQDVTARVLCDVNGSCATAGHMVVFEGVAMRMRAYCGVVGCSTEVRKVNSPRYRRNLRVKSLTEGLEFTAMAARYETRMEEVVLAAIVNLGL